MRAIRAMRGVLVFLCSIEHRACALNSFSTFRWANELNDTVNGSVPFLALDDTVQRAESNRTLG